MFVIGREGVHNSSGVFIIAREGVRNSNRAFKKAAGCS